MAGGGGQQQQHAHNAGYANGGYRSAVAALHVMPSEHISDNNSALPSLENDISRMARSLSDIACQSRSGGVGEGDELYRSASSSDKTKSRRNSSTSSSDLWSKRRRQRHVDGIGTTRPGEIGSVEVGPSRGGGAQRQLQQKGQSEPNYLCPDNAQTSISSSASLSSSSTENLESKKGPLAAAAAGRRQRRQHMLPPPNPASSATRSGLPPAPVPRLRRAPTSSSTCTAGSDSSSFYGAAGPPSVSSGLSRGVSIYEMRRRPSASMSAEDMDAIHSETASPIAFFADVRTTEEEEDRSERQRPPMRTSASVSTTPLTKIPYVHGAYSAVAPVFIRDARWMAILRKLMPESHAGVATLLKKSSSAPSKIDPLRLMKWAENNPVVAAYGTLNSDAGQKSHAKMVLATSSSRTPPKPALEWDVFLDPTLVRSVDRAMQAVEDLDKDETHNDASDFDALNARIAADVEVDRRMSRLMSRMMLAHGSTTQLVTEAVGMAARYNFSRVVEQGESRRRKSRWAMDSTLLESGCVGSDPQLAIQMGMSEDSSISPSKAYEADAAKAGRGSKTIAASGIFAERWLALFAKALKLGSDIATKTKRGSSRSKHFTSALLPDSSHDLRMRASSVSSSTNTSSQSDTDEEDYDDDRSVDSFVVETDEIVADPLSMCGLFLCLGMEDPNAKKADHSSSTMARSAKRIHKLLGAPLRVVLDLKSRKVPPRVWARLLDNLRTRGIGVDGIGSFDIDELRSIGSFCCTPVSKVIFLHSAGDLQRACHAQEIKRGDTVFFNAGSLIWKRPTLCEATGFGLCTVSATQNCADTADVLGAESDLFDPWNQNGLVLGGYSFRPYAYPREKLELLDGIVEECKATLEDYQRHLELNIGLYVQEFSIGDGALDAIAKLINHYPAIYNLGLAWGGINGATVKGVHGDGYWNQRYIGRDWDMKAEPTENMTLLAPEDHHLFQKAMHAGDWGQALTVNQIDIDPSAQGGLHGLHVPICKTPGAYGAPFGMHKHHK